ncbi:UNVERIFIED_CONTAM: hypothetical protein GTU68_002655 [Idotea baltica]|nr:hypothetical protein [Idotea baltica]
MSQPAALVFDLDGTLVHSLPDIHKAVGQLLAENDRPALDLATVQSFVGNGVPTLVKLVAEANDLGTSEDVLQCLTARMLEIYGAASADLTRSYPGVVEALTRFQSLGHPMAVCTNKPEGPARHILQKLDLAQFFSVVIGGDTLAQRKPDPTPLIHSFAALERSTGWFIGDSEVDAGTAKAADIPFALFSEGYRKSPVSDIAHRLHFSDFSDLPTVLSNADTPAI